MENCAVQTEKGKIIIAEKTIKKVILDAVKPLDDMMVFTDNKWKPIKWGRTLDVCDSNHFEITCADDGVCVELFLLIRDECHPNEITMELTKRIDNALISLLGKPSWSLSFNIQKNPKSQAEKVVKKTKTKVK